MHRIVLRPIARAALEMVGQSEDEWMCSRSLKVDSDLRSLFKGSTRPRRRKHLHPIMRRPRISFRTQRLARGRDVLSSSCAPVGCFSSFRLDGPTGHLPLTTHVRLSF